MDDISKTIGKNIGILCRQLSIYLNRELSAYDMTASEIMYLGSLFLKEGVTQDELANEFSVDKAAVARTVSTLERKGLIYRTCDESDKRSKLVFLTEKAMKYKDVLSDIQNRWYCEAIGDANSNEIALFAKTLEDISDNTRKLNEKESGKLNEQ